MNGILFLDSVIDDDDDENRYHHSLIGPAERDYKVKINEMSYQAYYIDGKIYSKSDWETTRKTHAK